AFEFGADRVVVRLAVAGSWRQRRVWTGEKACEITTLLPRLRPQCCDRPVPDREVTGLEIDEQRALWIEGAQLRGLTDLRRTDDQHLNAGFLAQSFVG